MWWRDEEAEIPPPSILTNNNNNTQARQTANTTHRCVHCSVVHPECPRARRHRTLKAEPMLGSFINGNNRQNSQANLPSLPSVSHSWLVMEIVDSYKVAKEDEEEEVHRTMRSSGGSVPEHCLPSTSYESLWCLPRSTCRLSWRRRRAVGICWWARREISWNLFKQEEQPKLIRSFLHDRYKCHQQQKSKNGQKKTATMKGNKKKKKYCNS